MLKLKNFFNSRFYIFFSMVFGVIISFCITKPNLTLASKFLIAWNIGVWCYLIITFLLIFNNDPIKAKYIAKKQDQNPINILIIMIMAIFLSYAAIILQLSDSQSGNINLKFFDYILTFSTIFVSWILLGVIFTFHYAHLFYTIKNKKTLEFPDSEEHLTYWDFLYFSFTINTSAQTADVCIKSTSIRKIVLFHSIISFFFNVAILGLSINIAAGLLGNN